MCCFVIFFNQSKYFLFLFQENEGWIRRQQEQKRLYYFFSVNICILLHDFFSCSSPLAPTLSADGRKNNGRHFYKKKYIHETYNKIIMIDEQQNRHDKQHEDCV